MKIGIIADTHGQVELAIDAAREFIFRGIEAVFHCGDIGSDMVLTEMAALFQTLDIPLYVVLGNTDSHSTMGYIMVGRKGRGQEMTPASGGTTD